MLIVDNCHGENQSGEGGIRTDGTSGHVFVGQLGEGSSRRRHLNKDPVEVREGVTWLSGNSIFKTEGTEKAKFWNKSMSDFLPVQETVSRPLWLEWSEQVTGSRWVERREITGRTYRALWTILRTLTSKPVEKKSQCEVLNKGANDMS